MLLRELKSIEKTGSGYILHGDAADVLLIFMTDDVIRVRVSFRRDFKEESYTLVTTAWEDRMDELLKDERTLSGLRIWYCHELQCRYQT